MKEIKAWAIFWENVDSLWVLENTFNDKSFAIFESEKEANDAINNTLVDGLKVVRCKVVFDDGK